MATDADQADQKEVPTVRHKFVGSKGPGESTDRILLDGNSADPEASFLYVGEEADLSEEQVEAFKAAGHVLRKVEEKKEEEEPKDGEGDSEGQDKAPEAPKPENKRQQQARQQAAAGVKPTVNQ